MGKNGLDRRDLVPDDARLISINEIKQEIHKRTPNELGVAIRNGWNGRGRPPYATAADLEPLPVLLRRVGEGLSGETAFWVRIDPELTSNPPRQ